MTAAQRATLEIELKACQASARSFPFDYSAKLAAALRAALGTCGNCQHAAARIDGGVWCSPPAGHTGFPFMYQDMPDGQRCTGWTAKEGA